MIRQMLKFLLVVLLPSLLVICPAVTAENAGQDKLPGRSPEKVPERIACLYAFTGHTVAMLGRGRDIVAVVKGLKKDKLLHQVLPEVKDLPAPFGGGVIHIESLLRTRPDMVFLKPETAMIPAEIKKLEQFGLPYFVAKYNSMAEQMAVIENMGRRIGCHEKALAYTRYYRDAIDQVVKRTRDIPEQDRVRLYHAINEANRTTAAHTLEADWTRACGVVNVSVRDRLAGRDNKSFASMEQILIWDPEVIIVNEQGVTQTILGDKKWSGVAAVRNKQVFQIPVGISRWGHPGGLETPLALLWTAKTVYPQKFRDIDMADTIQSFYQSFFNLNLTPEMTARILSGKGMRRQN